MGGGYLLQSNSPNGVSIELAVIHALYSLHFPIYYVDEGKYALWLKFTTKRRYWTFLLFLVDYL